MKNKLCLSFAGLILVLGMLSGYQAAFAQLSTGKIEGSIVDKDTGQPLEGVQVTVEGTRLGNLTNADGYYFVLNLPPGRRSITFAYTGYQKTTVTDQLILAGQTTTLNLGLSSTVVELEGIIVEGEANPLVPRDNTVTKHRMTSEAMVQSPSTSLEDLMVLEAGVQSGGEGGRSRGLRIRGGRIGEEAMVVDGVLVRNFVANPYRDGNGWVWEQEVGSKGEDTTPLELSVQSVEEVDIITGGFQAEFGNAQSGIINVVTKEGGPELVGNIRFTTDQVNGRTADYGYNQLQTSVGGPVPGIKNLFFHGSGEIQGKADNLPTHADEGFRGVNQIFVDRLNEAVRNDPVFGKQNPAYSLEMLQKGYEFWAEQTGNPKALFSPQNPVRLPNNWGDRTLASGKLTYSPFPGLKFLASANFSRIQRSYPTGNQAGLGGEGSYFQDGIVTAEEMPSRQWKPGETEAYVPQSYARRTRTSNSLVGFDWDFFRSAERSGALQLRFTNVRTQDINNSNQKTNWRREDNTFMSWALHDVQFENETYPNKEWPTEAEDRKKYFPDGDSGWHRTYSFQTPFGMHTNDWLYWIGYFYTRENQFNYKADLDFQLDRRNRAKLGMQVTTFRNRKFEIHNMNKQRTRNEFAYNPRMLGAYVQNRTDLGDFVFDYGLRYDSFKPNDNWGLRNDDVFGDRYYPQTFSSWSPRFDVAFPVTDKAQLRFSYGVFTQVPGMSYIFSGENPGGLEYARTDAFESGVSYLASPDIVLDLVAYYRDVDGNVATRSFFRDFFMAHENRRVRSLTSGYTNQDNGNVKGMDLTLQKRFSRDFAFNVSYTLQFSRTTGSYVGSPAASSMTYFDATVNETFIPPDQLQPMDGDRTHVMSATINYMFPQDFRSGTLAGAILKNVRLYSNFTLQSGEPLNGASRHSRAIVSNRDLVYMSSRADGLNYFRGRWGTNLDLRINKSFRLNGQRRMSFYSEIFNVLNHKDPYPYPSGYRYESYDHVTGGVDLNWNDPDLDINKRAMFKNDYNQDGILTVEEAAKGALASDFMYAIMDKQLWGLARQVRFGVEFSF